MIELIEDFPDNVVGIVARGRVTNEECVSVLRPAIERSLKRHRRLRLYYEVACRFPGAGWEHLNVVLEDMPHWERIAVVTDTAWVRHTVNALRFLLASDIRVFTALEADAGRDWIAAPDGDVLEAAVIANLRAPRQRQFAAAPARSRPPSARPAAQGARQYQHP